MKKSQGEPIKPLSEIAEKPEVIIHKKILTFREINGSIADSVSSRATQQSVAERGNTFLPKITEENASSPKYLATPILGQSENILEKSREEKEEIEGSQILKEVEGASKVISKI